MTLPVPKPLAEQLVQALAERDELLAALREAYQFLPNLCYAPLTQGAILKYGDK